MDVMPDYRLTVEDERSIRAFLVSLHDKSVRREMAFVYGAPSSVTALLDDLPSQEVLESYSVFYAVDFARRWATVIDWTTRHKMLLDATFRSRVAWPDDLLLLKLLIPRTTPWVARRMGWAV